MWPVDSSLRDVARRQVLRFPILMLKNRDDKDFVACSREDGVIGDIVVKRLEVGLHGATSIWSIDSATGRILEVAYVARHGAQWREYRAILAIFATSKV